MSAAAAALRIALVGNPNCGKTALFNVLTGSRQKVANYPGVTVERKLGHFVSPAGARVEVLDLPGTYSLRSHSPDQAVTRDVMLGRFEHEAAPDVVVCVVNATNLRLNLNLLLELRRLNRPIILALNMMDVAEQRGCRIDVAALAAGLGVPVVPTVAIRRGGTAGLLEQIDRLLPTLARQPGACDWAEPSAGELRGFRREVDRILADSLLTAARPPELTRRIDRVLLHPLAGTLFLLLVLFLVFQAVFTWAATPMDLIDAGMTALQEAVRNTMPDGPLRSLLADGVIAGVGSVLIFLPQILILFLFIQVLEASGYMTRAAFLLDRLMGGVGLHGRAFIPLLSSFACAIPGIMAARTIENRADRLVTIMIAPLMTCSARLPVYTLIIAAFIPARRVAGGLIGLQGLVMFALYATGIVAALAVAFVLKRTTLRGAREPLLMELPPYRWPNPRDVLLGLVERARTFLWRAGTTIFAIMVLLWFLASWPAPPEGATGSAIDHSLAGMIGHALAPLLAPVGFNWQIAIALVPGMAAREVLVAALGTVYAMSETGEALQSTLAGALAADWSLPTALALLAWFVFAPQCVSTLGVVRRETNSWRWPLIMFGYLMALAYAAAFVTFRVASALLGG
ncbi:ferrous iron transport protein B [Roseicella aquatilis]|uniref:Ferrous iron transport protein B n=1 Tax=Roseicella aquatilis TaxID=2527868 RepID=A0A4R4DII6_9PROT|nr:ferrous iron transport protein B [Roseicella aquatilis]TCZ59689.1 ferrous iron transport protein B [Roseicella aquatilis]